MTEQFDRFARIARSIDALSGSGVPSSDTTGDGEPHPFETRNIHPDLPGRVRKLFDDGHWEQAVFEAFKFVEKEIKRLSGLRGKTGFALMMAALDENGPAVQVNALSTDSEIDEQRGFRHMFAGAAAGIRNPRGHEVEIGDTLDESLDYLALASLLLRRLDAAGLRSPDHIVGA